MANEMPDKERAMLLSETAQRARAVTVLARVALFLSFLIKH